jgi:hypothetical protein
LLDLSKDFRVKYVFRLLERIIRNVSDDLINASKSSA